MEDVLRDVLDRNRKVLVIALGDKARSFFEQDLRERTTEQFNSIDDIVRSRANVRVLFLDKLQYLYMYLTYVEIELQNRESPSMHCEEIIIHGLESLLFTEQQLDSEKATPELSVAQLRHCNLILHGSLRLQNRYAVRIRMVSATDLGDLSQDWEILTQYWHHIYSISDS
ncbi:unnamed protein product [Kluyveromyces dobzhanskii CBS 2104]|uniref:WGS project CCBQ000000000 data, contig 00015 n=1 Tax=Kluyveromyces dobzhanskii CBS 2104 TaxID=1427455 RepID=A0A0A8LCI7_9SACH|nr:unnamed protein product [Kluyveromyces dobzhanskii CBS 2104]